MWKIVLVLFLVSDTNPGGIMFADMPQSFKSESECREFVSTSRDDIFSGVEYIVEETAGDSQLLHHEANCVQDSTGQGI